MNQTTESSSKTVIISREKTCKQCSKIYTKRAVRDVFCSRECSDIDEMNNPKSIIQKTGTCPQCSAAFTFNSTTQKFCSADCRKLFTFLEKESKRPKRCCPNCNIDISHTVLTKEYCSDSCKRLYVANKKYTGIENIDYIICPVCQIRTSQMTPSHAKMHGFESIQDMKQKLNMPLVTCEKKKALIYGENNPGFNHGGKLSAWSKNFVKGYVQEWVDKQRVANSIWNKEHAKENYFMLEYWLEQTNGDLEEAKRLHIQSQTRSLEWFVEKFGEEDGKIRHQAKTEKWIKSFKKSNFSVISQKLFKAIMLLLPDTSNIYFATHDRADKEEYENKEYILKVDGTYVRPDFVDIVTKKVIEFDGDYWHSAAVANPERERIRDEKILNEGFTILHIAECDYKQDQKQVIDRCIKFLTT